jgi:hypothetical protein
MALHQRQQIRDATQAALLNQTSAGPRVFKTRDMTFHRKELPALAVYTLQETVDPASADTAPLELKRTLQLAIEGAVSLTDNVDDALDALAVDVERAMHRDDSLGATASLAMLSATEVDIFEQGDRPMGLVRLTYTVTYYTNAPEAADTPLDDLKTVDIRHSLEPGVNPANQAHDTVTL